MKVHFSTCLAVLLACGLLFAMSGMAQAFPSFAATVPPAATQNSCKDSCHNEDLRTDAMQVIGADGTLDLTAADRNDGKDRGPLELYVAKPGDTVLLSMEVLDGADEYAVQLKRFDKDGILAGTSGDSLAGYTPDGGWVAQGTLPLTYYTNTAGGTSWTGGPVGLTFSLQLAATTPRNVYDLEFALAGHDATAKFYQDEHFYLQVVPEPASFVLVGLGLSLLGLVVCRRKAAA